jgi:hypothetical protein
MFLMSLFFSELLIGQSYMFNPGTVYITNVDTSQNNFGGIEVQNTGSQNLNLTWRLASVDTLIDSKFELCNSGTCFMNLPYSGAMPTITPGNIGWIKFHMFSGITTGTNTIKYVLKNGSVQKDTLTFIIIVGGNTAGLSELGSVKDKMSLYPNPATNQSGIQLTLAKPLDVTLTAIDGLGNILYKTTQSCGTGNQLINFNTENWASGIYTINVSTINGITSRKLVITK